MEENATEVKDKDLVLIEASNEVSKPDEGEDAVSYTHLRAHET